MARGVNFLLLAGMLAHAGLVRAELADPMRPPHLSGATAAAATPGGAGAGLQSIIKRRDGRSVAVIDGAIVARGDRVGDAELVEIRDQAVVLRGPRGERILRLAPGAAAKVGAGATANGKETVR